MRNRVPSRSVVLGTRALIAAIGGLYITFSQAKGFTQTLAVLALFCIGQVLVIALAFALDRDRSELLARLPIATVALAVAVLASLGNVDQAAVYTKVHWLIIIWGLLSGAFGLWLAKRSGIRFSRGGDAYISAGLSLALAALLLIFPNLDIISTEGFFGAYLIIDAVNLGIAAATPEPERS